MSVEDPKFSKKVDEDWKAAARREKEKLAAANKPHTAENGAEAGGGQTDSVFVGFLNQLVGQTMMDLGMMAHPLTGQREVNLDQARQMIEVLRALDRKSKKHQSAEEAEFFRQVLAEVQMMYVQTAQAMGAAPTGAAGPRPAGPPPTKRGGPKV